MSANSQRISYTDYYPNTAGAGSRGMTYKTYSDPYAVWTAGTLPCNDANWQTDPTPNTTNYDSYSSETAYDPYGRATDVYKLQTVSGGAYKYVHTNTGYGPNNGTWWGEPEVVTEHVGGINRVTQTLAYDSSGHATKTEDAAGHIFQTNYANQDYQVSSIVETDCTPNVTLVSYTYGTGADNGQVTSVTDGLSGVVDNFSYDDSPPSGDGGIGQPSTVTEQWPWDTGGIQHGYNVGYTYDQFGDRDVTTYTTDNGVTIWQYDNYGAFGVRKNGNPLPHTPQTMRLLQGGSPTAEEFHYEYDTNGALQAATFAMTPESGFSPSGDNPWYDENDLPSIRARVLYDTMAGGQVQNVYYFWDTWSSSAGDYTSADITGFQYSYDPVSWLRTQATFLDGNGTSWVTNHDEIYGYDAIRDYLTSANYGGSTEYWTYDASGNRLSDSGNPGAWSYDNLNRMTTSPGLSYSNDILGNRLSYSENSQTWDSVNRMTSFAGGSGATTYTYRPDGLRALKSNSATSTSYAYDGQTGFEDVDSGPTPAVTDYAIGARGIDRIAKTSAGTVALAYPIYDGHGNMVETLSESNGSYACGNVRQYDAWGNIIGTVSSGDPKGRYCANLGHKQDDESGLVYMRSRYYDPRSGTFINQDPDERGSNWFSYGSSNPVRFADASGRDDLDLGGLLAGSGDSMILDGNIGGSAYLISLSAPEDSAILQVWVQALNGVRGVSTLLNALRFQAISSGFAQIVLSADTLAAGSRAAVFAAWATKAILSMGDQAFNQSDNDFFQIYWLLSINDD